MKSNFDDLMSRYLTDQVTDQERVKVEAWLGIMKTGKVTDRMLGADDLEKLFQKITNNLVPVSDVQAFRPQSRSRFLSPVLKVAAAILLLVVASIVVWSVYVKSSTQQHVAAGSVEKIFLSDGTIVWLRPGA